MAPSTCPAPALPTCPPAVTCAADSRARSHRCDRTRVGKTGPAPHDPATAVQAPTSPHAIEPYWMTDERLDAEVRLGPVGVLFEALCRDGVWPLAWGAECRE